MTNLSIDDQIRVAEADLQYLDLNVLSADIASLLKDPQSSETNEDALAIL